MSNITNLIFKNKSHYITQNFSSKHKATDYGTHRKKIEQFGIEDGVVTWTGKISGGKAVKIKYPKPLLEPIISAEIVHIKAIPTPTLSPETIGGTAEGKITCVSTVLSSAPSVCADSIKTLSVLLTPSIV